MKITVRGYIYHKEAESYSDCVDRYGLNTNSNKFAISDGVTSSFFPGIWADLLISEFIDNNDKIKHVDSSYFNSIQNTWFNKIKLVAENSSKWVLRKNLNDRRPAFATFVGLHFYNENSKWIWEAFALGDSFLFFVPETLTNISFGENENSTSYLSSKINLEFDNYPDYFASQGDGKGEVKTKSGLLDSGNFFLMTDALAEWFIKEKEIAFEIIKSWDSHSSFTDTIDRLRLENRLHNDDSTILIITTKNDGLETINYQSEDIDSISELTENEKKEETKISASETFSSNETVSKIEEALAKNEVNQEAPLTESIVSSESNLSQKNHEKPIKRIVDYKTKHSTNDVSNVSKETILNKISKGAKNASHSVASFLHIGNSRIDSENKEVNEEKNEVTSNAINIVEIRKNDTGEVKKIISKIENEQLPKTEDGKTSNTIINKF